MNAPARDVSPALPPLPGVPRGGGGGRIKAEPRDFVVEEIPAYAPAGDGEFYFIEVEKEDVAAGDLLQLVARRLGVPRETIGAAGMKDRRAITRQWLSVPARGVDPSAVEGPVGAHGAIRLLTVGRHPQKLRTGHLHGNRFTVRLLERRPEDDAQAVAILEALAVRGMPNAFGEQRFGRGGTLNAGLAVLRGDFVRDRHLRRLGISAVQAWVFNLWLARRLADGTLEQALDGDVLKKRESGGIFNSSEPDVDTARIAAGELVVTGPLPGSKLRKALGPAAAIEEAAMVEAGLSPTAFASMGKLAPGTRRPALVFPKDIGVERDERGLVLRFSLPPGAYATVLLAAICGSQGGDEGADEPEDLDDEA
jgi:tRNA pseudouridine13 synthase